MDSRTLMLLLLGALAAGARADCEACVAGACYSRKTLIQGFHVSDRLALDHTNNILYVQLNSNLNTAFFLDDLQIHLIQTLNTTSMAFDQDEKVLYTADAKKKLYKYKRDGNETELVANDMKRKNIDLMFYKDFLYYTSKERDGLLIIEDGIEKYFNYLVNYTITDFVITKDKYVYFVANENVYLYQTSWTKAPELVASKKFVLSIDKHDNVYFGDAAVNVIYKINELTKLVEFAAYKTGSVDRFVFDSENNIVFHDAESGDVISWKPQYSKCNIHAPHAKYSIEDATDNECQNSGTGSAEQ